MQKLVYQYQLESGDVECLEVIDDRLVSQPGIGVAKFFGNARVGLCHALDMGFLGDSLVVGDERCLVERLAEKRIDHHAGHGVTE